MLLATVTVAKEEAEEGTCGVLVQGAGEGAKGPTGDFGASLMGGTGSC